MFTCLTVGDNGAVCAFDTPINLPTTKSVGLIHFRITGATRPLMLNSVYFYYRADVTAVLNTFARA